MLLGVIWGEEHEFSISFLLGTRVFRDFWKNTFFQLKRMQRVEFWKNACTNLNQIVGSLKEDITDVKLSKEHVHHLGIFLRCVLRELHSFKVVPIERKTTRKKPQK